MTKQDHRLRDAVLRHDLSSFVAKSFLTVSPRAHFASNWHIDAVAEYLQECARGGCPRLIINMPPRMLKSLTVSVSWPAWLLGHNPAARVISASYSSRLAIKHALDTRLVMRAKWYRRLFPWVALSDDQNEKHKFVTTERGFRLAASVGGTLTGEGGDFIIVDDPINPRQAASDIQREHANSWFDQTLMSRLDDPQHGCVVVVMQRLHENDLSGHLLKTVGDSWEQLILPAYAEHTISIDVADSSYLFEEGSYLQESRLDRKTLQRIRRQLGSYGYAAQYQQQPMAVQGGMLQLRWFKRLTLPLRKEATASIIQSWDTAIKDGSSHDYSVCTTWQTREGKLLLLDVCREKLDYPSLRKKSISLAEYWKPEAILIEDKASGQSLLQELRRTTHLPVIGIMPKFDKKTRAASVSAMMEAGRVWLPTHAKWLPVFEEEIVRFPQGSHDDQVDSMCQFLQWIQTREVRATQIRVI